jgi:carotenoid cleavage dioxygenase-like enzyme
MTRAFDIGFGEIKNEISVDELSIQGKVPEWLSGDLLRNGPGSFRVGKDHYNHWFDGLAMLHRFTFRKGTVSYQNKFLECNAYYEAKEKNKIVYSEFATDPCYTIFDRFKAIFNPQMTDSAKVNIDRIGKKVLALNETSLQVEFDPKTLKSLGVFNYDENPGRHMTTVHPHFDRFKNKSYNITTRFGRVNRYRILEVEEHQNPVLLASIPTNVVSYMHSFGMSQNYFILTEFPFQVNPIKFMISGKPFIENFKWKPGRGTHFHIVDRRNGKNVIKLKTKAFFAFHHVNAFEVEDNLFVDILCYDNADVVESFYLRKIKSEQEILPVGEFRRYKINFTDNSISYEVLGDELIELTRFNYDRYSMDGDYRYVYGVGVNKENPQSFFNQLVKMDLKSNQTETWYKKGCYPGEPIFVATPGGVKENDGVLLSVVLNEEKENSFLLILNAATFEEIARAEVPQPILFGYHGYYLLDEYSS